jgi:hypothetical protein
MFKGREKICSSGQIERISYGKMCLPQMWQRSSHEDALVREGQTQKIDFCAMPANIDSRID